MTSQPTTRHYALEGLNFFMADVQAGIGPFLGVFLLARDWQPQAIGTVMTLGALTANSPETVIDALLIGVDLGPNLSITGSLATILWLAAIRREGEEVSFMQFSRIGVIVMLPALVLALGARLIAGH